MSIDGSRVRWDVFEIADRRKPAASRCALLRQLTGVERRRDVLDQLLCELVLDSIEVRECHGAVLADQRDHPRVCPDLLVQFKLSGGRRPAVIGLCKVDERQSVSGRTGLGSSPAEGTGIEPALGGGVRPTLGAGDAEGVF